MIRDTLLDFFDDFASRPEAFLTFDDGLRNWTYSYRQVAHAACAFGARLDAAGVVKGDKVVLWGENRPEWVVALWGCITRGVIVVPIDFRTSSDFLLRVRAIVEAKIVLVGDDVASPTWPEEVTVWPLRAIITGADHAITGRPALALTRADVVQIIFTSGATSEPKGVVITHGNLLANIVPIEREIRKYRRWGRPFFPIRFLNLLPLSHLFGQSMATFIPPMLAGTVVFMRGYNPHDIARQVRSRRVSVLVCVPKMLDVLREYIVHACPSTAQATEPGLTWWQRWWRHRDVHRLFGWKFWSFVVGAAPLDPALEEFWSGQGYLVIQGYGLTETAPIVTLNHPFSARKGSVGKPIHGVELRLAPDGEILVRGENVTQGYYGVARSLETFEDGWLHTGDIGGIDEEGRVYIRGRKKEMIVTADGLNVFPEDVERVLLAQPGVRDAAVVGHLVDGEERVHAVLVTQRDTDTTTVLQRANTTLADHQRLRSVSVWPGTELPRTEGTRKLKRRDIKAWVDGGGAPVAAPPAKAATVEAVLLRFVHGSGDLHDDVALDALGLSSLERVELLMALEERFELTLDEATFAEARTVGDLKRVVGYAGTEDAAPPVGGPTASDARRSPSCQTRPAVADAVEFPRWNRRGWASAVRRASQPTWLLPLLRILVKMRVEGRQHLEGLKGPVVFAANHQSHLDAPTILAALPPRFRYRLAIAMAKEFFKAHFFPEQYGRRAWLLNSINYYLAALFFGAFPLPQREAGTRQTLRYVGELASEGLSILIFPEGKRTDGGEINVFRSGVGMMASRLSLPVVPIKLVGLDRILHHSWHMAKPGTAVVRFGAPLHLSGEDYAALARRVEEAVREL